MHDRIRALSLLRASDPAPSRRSLRRCPASSPSASGGRGIGDVGGGASTALPARPRPPRVERGSSARAIVRLPRLRRAPPAPAAAGTLAAGAPTADEADEAAEWAERDCAVNESNTLTGGTGLLQTQHAQTGAPGQFRLGFVAEWFSAGFLCTSKFPCPNPNGGAALTSDTMSHVGGTLSLGAIAREARRRHVSTGTPAIVAYANSDSANSPSLLQVLGDIGPRRQVRRPGRRRRSTSGSSPSCGSSTARGRSASTAAARAPSSAALGTADLRGLELATFRCASARNVALLPRQHGRGPPATRKPRARATPVTRIERYGLGVNRVDHSTSSSAARLRRRRARPALHRGERIWRREQPPELRLPRQQPEPGQLPRERHGRPRRRSPSAAASSPGSAASRSSRRSTSASAARTTSSKSCSPSRRGRSTSAPAGRSTRRIGRRSSRRSRREAVGAGRAARPRRRASSTRRTRTIPIVGAIVAYRDRSDLPRWRPDPTAIRRRCPARHLHVRHQGRRLQARRRATAAGRRTCPAGGAEVRRSTARSRRCRASGTVVGHVRDADTSQPIGGVQVVVHRRAAQGAPR